MRICLAGLDESRPCTKTTLLADKFDLLYDWAKRHATEEGIVLNLLWTGTIMVRAKRQTRRVSSPPCQQRTGYHEGERLPSICSFCVTARDLGYFTQHRPIRHLDSLRLKLISTHAFFVEVATATPHAGRILEEACNLRIESLKLQKSLLCTSNILHCFFSKLDWISSRSRLVSLDVWRSSIP